VLSFRLAYTRCQPCLASRRVFMRVRHCNRCRSGAMLWCRLRMSGSVCPDARATTRMLRGGDIQITVVALAIRCWSGETARARQRDWIWIGQRPVASRDVPATGLSGPEQAASSPDMQQARIFVPCSIETAR
jgi:hypothetical protein